MSESKAGALSGIRILDFSRVLAGPYATMLLADFGAEIIKVERPDGGDDTRSWGPPWYGEESTYFLAVNRNKQSHTIDLKSEAAQREMLDLARTCDVLVENFRPGAMARLGLGYEDIKNINPGIVYCSISGFGSSGGAHLAGYDLIAQAAGGLMSVTGHAETGPAKAGVALVDIITGLHAAIGIQTALYERFSSGTGQLVEVNLLSSLLSALSNQASAHILTGDVPGLMGNAHPSVAPYQPLTTADRPLTVAATTNAQFAKFVQAIGRPDLANQSTYRTNADRVAHREALIAELETSLKSETADYWFETLSAVGIPCAPINDLGQAVKLADRLGLEPVVRPEGAAGGIAQVRNPISLSRTPARYRTPPPELECQ
ncbi:CaiB/BaiF CoA transferase family protein [Rhodococcus qingshengii]|uniref:CaiB/BaiF CoA transferase family protein n=1 Tax=Rhodococcus qingshengii TaxID=334542 RepID=UPI0010A69BF0|nr:CoA transferase [Rhodococcus qingshengii]THJ67662.1 CoA transferase [Rhodococcus qingshengii]